MQRGYAINQYGLHSPYNMMESSQSQRRTQIASTPGHHPNHCWVEQREYLSKLLQQTANKKYGTDLLHKQLKEWRQENTMLPDCKKLKTTKISKSAVGVYVLLYTLNAKCCAVESESQNETYLEVKA